MASMASMWAMRIWAAEERRTRRPWGSRRGTPSSLERRRICWEAAEVDMCRDFAAPETVPWWAMARSTCSRRRSITVALSLDT